MRMEEVEFPSEITIDILSRLPVESILECKRVCKTWETLIEDPLFLTTYTARQSFSDGDGNGDGDGDGDGSEYCLGFCIMGYRRQDHGYGSCAVIHYGEYRPNAASEGACFKVTKPIKSPYNWFKEDISAVSWNLIGSSNGLICLSACLPGFEQLTYTVYVYNPMTKEFVNLGHETFTSPGHTDGYKAYRAMGFGYHPSTKEYKVIVINCKSCYSSWTRPAGHVKVYTLGGSNSSSSKCRWRDKGEIPYRFTTLHKPGVLVNGALHWLTEHHKIMSFDLADEEFRTILAPPGIDLNCVYSLGALRGCLCVYVKTVKRTSVWVLKKYMMNESWTKILISENDTHHLKEEDAVWRSSGCGCGAFVSHFDSKKKKIVSYDSESGSISFVSNIGCFSNYEKLHIVSYTKSFVSLKALGEEDIQHAGGIC